MKPLSSRSPPVNLLPNDGQERNQHNDQMNAQSEAKIPASVILTDDQREEMWTFLRAYSMHTEEERVPSSQSSQAEAKYCYEKSTFLLIVILFGIFSTGMSCFVLYQVLGEDTKCQCSFSKDYIKGHAIRQNFTDVLNDLKAKLKQDIEDLRNKMDDFSRTLNDDHQCDGDSKDCRRKSGDGFSDAYKKTEENLERLYNQTEENIVRRFQQTNAKVERITEQNDKPKCLLKQAKQSKNSTLFTVHVPKSTEDRVTVAVTCSTTLENTADVRYMVPSSDDDDEYICHCDNKITKRTDCVAYYWQCRL